MHPRRSSLLLLLLAPALLAWAAPCAAQGLFGKNKITYDRRDWFSIKTEHCEVFYYADEEGLAREVAAIAESTAAEYDTLFRMRPRKRIPILSYASHQAFQQSHAASGFIDEGTGGLTELVRGRVLIPHTGSTPRLVWVTRHELVHAYMLEKLSQIQHESHKYRSPFPPLWFTEGFAEFVATKWDATAEGLMQDAVTTDVAVPLMKSLPIEGTVLMYKEGQSFLEWTAANYGGTRAVFDRSTHWTEQATFDEIWGVTFGRPLRDMDADWFEEMRRHYYPAVATRSPVSQVGRELTNASSYNLAPCVLPQAPGTRSSASPTSRPRTAPSTSGCASRRRGTWSPTSGSCAAASPASSSRSTSSRAGSARAGTAASRSSPSAAAATCCTSTTSTRARSSRRGRSPASSGWSRRRGSPGTARSS